MSPCDRRDDSKVHDHSSYSTTTSLHLLTTLASNKMPPKNRRRRRLQVSTSFKGDDGSHSDSGRETERKFKKVRWEHNSNTMDGEGDSSDSDESSAGLEQVIMSSVFSYLRVDESVQICLTTWCKQYVILQQLLPVRHP